MQSFVRSGRWGKREGEEREDISVGGVNKTGVAQWVECAFAGSFPLFFRLQKRPFCCLLVA